MYKKNDISKYLDYGKHEIMTNHLMSIDNTQILGRRINELAAILCIAKETYTLQNKQFNKIELFEAGNNPVGSLDSGLYTHNTGFFFINHPEFLKYTGYDPEYRSLDGEDFQICVLNDSYKRRKSIRHSKKLFETYKKTQTKNYEEFKEKIENSQNPVIFSNYVLGCPTLSDEQFWNLKGTHAHIVCTGDLEIQWVKKFKSKEFNRLNSVGQGREDTYESISLEFLKHNDCIPIQEQIPKIMNELYNTPKESKEHLLSNNHAILHYILN